MYDGMIGVASSVGGPDTANIKKAKVEQVKDKSESMRMRNAPHLTSESGWNGGRGTVNNSWGVAVDSNNVFARAILGDGRGGHGCLPKIRSIGEMDSKDSLRGLLGFGIAAVEFLEGHL